MNSLSAKRERSKHRRWERDATHVCRLLKEYSAKLHSIADRLRTAELASRLPWSVTWVGLGICAFVLMSMFFWLYGFSEPIHTLVLLVVSIGITGITWNILQYRLLNLADSTYTVLVRRQQIAGPAVSLCRIASGLLESTELEPLIKTELLLRVRETENALLEAKTVAQRLRDLQPHRFPEMLITDGLVPDFILRPSAYPTNTDHEIDAAEAMEHAG